MKTKTTSRLHRPRPPASAEKLRRRRTAGRPVRADAEADGLPPVPRRPDPVLFPRHPVLIR